MHLVRLAIFKKFFVPMYCTSVFWIIFSLLDYKNKANWCVRTTKIVICKFFEEMHSKFYMNFHTKYQNTNSCENVDDGFLTLISPLLAISCCWWSFNFSSCRFACFPTTDIHGHSFDPNRALAIIIVNISRKVCSSRILLYYKQRWLEKCVCSRAPICFRALSIDMEQ